MVEEIDQSSPIAKLCRYGCDSRSLTATLSYCSAQRSLQHVAEPEAPLTGVQTQDQAANSLKTLLEALPYPGTDLLGVVCQAITHYSDRVMGRVATASASNGKHAGSKSKASSDCTSLSSKSTLLIGESCGHSTKL